MHTAQKCISEDTNVITYLNFINELYRLFVFCKYLGLQFELYNILLDQRNFINIFFIHYLVSLYFSG